MHTYIGIPEVDAHLYGLLRVEGSSMFPIRKAFVFLFSSTHRSSWPK